MQNEITTTSLYLTKDGYLRKSPKSELAQVLKSHISEMPSEVLGAEIPSALIIDFMAYCRKVPVKKLQLKTYADFARHLWGTFQRLSTSSQRIDIIFDLYLDQSIKEGERNRRNQGFVETTIKQLNLTLPIDMDKFWDSASNKMQLEQIFIEWIMTSYKGSIPWFLEGAHKGDITSCVMISNGEVSFQPILRCDHEEADDRILFHANHAIKVNDFKKIIIASPDTDVFVNVIHHFSSWIFSDIKEL